MKNRLISSVTVIAILGTGCAFDPMQRAQERLAKGDCVTAVNIWVPRAKAGDAAAENNLGVVWERGCPAGKMAQNYDQSYVWYQRSANHNYPIAHYNLGMLYLHGKGKEKDEKQAIQYFDFAARWGIQESIKELRSLNAQIPPTDLLDSARINLARNRAAAQARDQEDADAWAMFGMALVGGIAQGYAASRSATQPSNNYVTPAYVPTESKPIRTLTQEQFQSQEQPHKFLSPTNSSVSAASHSVAQSVTRSNAQVGAHPSIDSTSGDCASDYSCGVGMRCAKAPYASMGVCLKTVDSSGVPSITMPSSDSIGLRTAPMCDYGIDCPTGFRCDINLKMCVK